MARLLLLAGDPVAAGAVAQAWARRRPGAAWLDAARLACRLVPGDGGTDPRAAAVAATCAAAVELVAAGLDVAVAGGPGDEAEYGATWRPAIGALDHRLVVLAPGDVEEEGAAALDRELDVPGSGWRDDVVEDAVVRLRPVREGDVPAIVAACQDPEISRWTTVPSPYDEHHAVEFVRRAAEGRRRGTGAAFTMADPAGDGLLGCISVFGVDWTALVGTVGYWVAAGARGRGVARHALGLLSRWSFDRLGLARLQLDVVVGNEASCRVAEAAGYRREGLRRAALPHRDGRADVLGYALLAVDLEEAGRG
jgi:RimJ/RimL family protein N-acetyltransferase